MSNWELAERPGYQGKRKDADTLKWNQIFGEGNWKLAWVFANGLTAGYPEIFEEYVASYTEYFKEHPEEAGYLTGNFSYTWDKEEVSREEAFDPYARYNVPGKVNQFHNVALNIALEKRLRQPFTGTEPLQVREGKPGTDPSIWPAGWRWSPGRIPAARPELIPTGVVISEAWWQTGSIEHLYQAAKALLVKKT